MTISETSSLEETLNAFIADEYFANMQYKMAKVVAKGKALNFANKIFDDNGDEEDEHFGEIIDYAQSLDIPVQINIAEMQQNCTTPYVELHDGDTTAQLVAILISAEEKAISGYETALRNTSIVTEHPELVQFFGELLNDERGHLKELKDLMSNIEADGKTVPQADDISIDNMDDTSDTKSTMTDLFRTIYRNESIDTRSASRLLMGLIEEQLVSAEKVFKDLINYISEDDVADFVEEYDLFDVDNTKSIDIVRPRPCTTKLFEMIDDGILHVDENLVTSLIVTLSDDEVADFNHEYGYDGASDDIVESFQITESLSFKDIFNSIK